MSVEYYYVNDLNKLFNAAVSDRTDGGEHHSEMMRSLDNLEAYIQNLEHWRDTALQLSKNTGEKCAELARLTTDRDGIAEENRMLSERIQRLVEGVKSRDEELATIKGELEIEKNGFIACFAENAELRESLIETIDKLVCRAETIERLKEDGNRLVESIVFEVYGNEYVNPLYACAECGNNGESKDFEHVTGCPVTLHRALMKELE